MKHSILTILSASLFLSACGGGGGSSNNAPIADNSAAINAAIPGVANNVPLINGQTPKPFTGAFMLIEGQSIGYVNATSPRAAVEVVARIVMGDVTKYSGFYKAMLSDAGMRVEVVGESMGKSLTTGVVMYAPNVVFVVKAMKDGTVVISG